jgi:hypothetical protein
LFDILAHMSMLRSALDELRGDDLRSLPDDALAGHLDEIERAGRVLEFERGRRLAELERRKVYAVDGHLSAAGWLAQRQGLSRSAAEGRVQRARALEAMPEVARAFGEGEVSESAVHVLASAGRLLQRRSHDPNPRSSMPRARWPSSSSAE